jgi:hypothetical protein
VDAVDLWAGSVCEFNERRRERTRAAWIAYHTNQAERHRRALQALVDHHEGQAEWLNAELTSRAPARVGDSATVPTFQRSQDRG